MSTSRLAQILGGLAASTVVGINVFTINCGSPVTDIVIQKAETPSVQIPAILALIGNHSVVFESPFRTSCASFQTAAQGSIACSVRSKDDDGPAGAAVAGSCVFSDDGGQADGTHFYAMTCSTADGAFCVAGARTVATLSTATDFVPLVGSPSLEGYVVVDANNPAVKMTLHDAPTYCADTFTLE